MRTYDVRILSVKMIKGIAPRKACCSETSFTNTNGRPTLPKARRLIASTDAVRQAILRLKSLQISPMPKTFGEAIETSRNKKNCATKLHPRGDFYDPHLLTRGSPKNGVSASQGLPELRRASAAAQSFAPGQTLVERFDIETFSDFSAK